MGVLISYPDRTLAALLSGGSWQTGAGLANLQNPLLSAVARSTNAQASSSIIQVDLGAELPIRVISLCGHNLTKDAMIRVRGYSDSGYTTLVAGADNAILSAEKVVGGDLSVQGVWQSTVGATFTGGRANINTASVVSSALYQYTSMFYANKYYKATYTISNYTSGSIRFAPGGENAYCPLRSSNGTFTEYFRVGDSIPYSYLYFATTTGGFIGSIDDVSVMEITNVSAWPISFTAQNVTDYPKNWTYCFSSPKTARYWKIEIVDTANPAGYIELGRCWLGEGAFEPARSMLAGYQVGYNLRDIVEESLGGVDWIQARTPRRSQVVTFPDLTMAEARTGLVMIKNLTMAKELLFVTDTNHAAADMLMYAYIARIKSASPLTYPYFSRADMPLEVIESI